MENILQVSEESQKALNFIRHMGDRCVQRGGLFNDATEFLSFINAYNYMLASIVELERMKAANGIKTETIK
jgi:hypothetical protein